MAVLIDAKSAAITSGERKKKTTDRTDFLKFHSKKKYLCQLVYCQM